MVRIIRDQQLYNFQFVEQIRAYFHTPSGVLCDLRFCDAPKPPLCKGRWHGVAVTEGLLPTQWQKIQQKSGHMA